jgi:hypothetical protein
MTEFWNSDTTEASWNGLQRLSKEIDFVLIGGWATYLYTKLQKSKDIDIVADYNSLRVLEDTYRLSKNDRLCKYEIKLERYDIDIYLPGYSVLTVPPKDILHNHHTSIEGFNVATAEALLALKLGAASDRGNSIKGQKDKIDILGILFYARPDLQKLKAMLAAYGKPQYLELLQSTLAGFNLDSLNYLNLNQNSFSKLKKRHLEELRSI